MLDAPLPVVLKRRALRWLAQREHSRAELRRKLLGAGRRLSAGAAGNAGSACNSEADAPPPTPAADIVDNVLDQLAAAGLLCDARVAESRIHVRSTRFGVRRIEAELQRLGVSAAPEAIDALRSTETDRARAVWARKYGGPAADAAGRARQMRFLAGRGFSNEAIRRVVFADASAEPDPDDNLTAGPLQDGTAEA